MQTMKAICLPGPGADLELMEIPVPKIDANEALVAIRAFGVGLHDRYTMPGNIEFPYPIGLEGAGIVEEVGSAVTAFKRGDRVMITGMHPKGGTWAEYAAIHAQMLMPMPDGFDFQDAAALPVAGNTALEGVKALHLRKGETLFIGGSSGAIGTIAIQLAVRRGYRVAASASPANHDYLRSLGVELPVDYRNPDWAAEIKEWVPGGVDAALAIQRGTGQTSLAAVRDGGQVVTISGDQVRTERNINVEQMMHGPDTRAEFLEMAADVASGKMRVAIEQVYPFAQAVAALEKTETGHARGKIIVTVGNR
ncbi:MAG: quinone oxidoreductase family protein [Thermomicrobiales bacterium]